MRVVIWICFTRIARGRAYWLFARAKLFQLLNGEGGAADIHVSNTPAFVNVGFFPAFPPA